MHGRTGGLFSRLLASRSPVPRDFYRYSIGIMRTTTHLLFAIALIVVAGCDGDPPLPQHAGIVFAHVGSASSKTGTSSLLDKTGQLGVGFHYGGAEAIDWEASVNWKFLASTGTTDSYRLSWVFTPVTGEPTSGDTEITYNGNTQSAAVVNDQLTVTIDPIESQTGE